MLPIRLLPSVTVSCLLALLILFAFSGRAGAAAGLFASCGPTGPEPAARALLHLESFTPGGVYLQRRRGGGGRYGRRGGGAAGGGVARGRSNFEDVTGRTVNSAPVLGPNNIVYVSSWNDDLYALDKATGAVRWKFVTGKMLNASPAVGPDGTVYVGSFDHYVYAIDGATGRRKWAYRTGDIVDTTPAIDKNGTVYVGGYDHSLYALDSGSGAVKWQYRTSAPVGSPIIGSSGWVYACGDRVYAFDAQTGGVRWIHDLSYNSTAPIAVGGLGEVFVADHNGNVIALDQKSGAQLWEANIGSGTYSAPIVLRNELLVPADKLYALSVNDGSQRWTYDDGGDDWSTPVTNGRNTVLIGSDDQSISAVNATNGTRLWRFETDDPLLSFPTVGPDGSVYVACESNNRVMALDGRSGQTRWQFAEDPVPPSAPAVNVPARTANR